MSGYPDLQQFAVEDYVVFGSLILVSILLGIFFAIRDKKHNTSVNYFLGNRKQKALPLGISFVVTFQSAIIFLGTPAEVYVYGLQYAVQLIGVFLSFILAAVVVAPLYHPLNVTTCYEYYYLRYRTNSVRYLGVVLGTLYYTIYLGVVFNGTALALESTTGLPKWLTIVTFASASIFYTSIGGIKAVIWTDVFQSIVMVTGMITVLVKTLISIGGVGKLDVVGHERLNVFDFNPDPTIRHTFWTLVLGSIPQFFYTAITQAGVQRIISTPNLKTAKMIVYIVAPIYCIVWSISMFEGLAIFAYFKEKRCDPIESGQVKNPNQIVPFIMMELFNSYRGVPGLFIAALAAASLSTISSGLSGLAAVACCDILRVAKPNVSDTVATNLSKLFVVIFGLISVGLAFILSSVTGPLGQIMGGFTGAVAGPETGMFLVSVFFRRSRPKAVIVSTVLVLIVSVWLILGQSFSSGVKQTPYLPLGPTDQCSINENVTVNSSSLNGEIYSANTAYVANTTAYVYNHAQSTTIVSQDASEAARSGLDTLYSISYMYFHLVGAVVTIILAVIGSLLTQPKRPEILDERCVLSFSIFVPGICRRGKKLELNTSRRSSRTSDVEHYLMS